MRWDVFICHASEDKDDVAVPLARTLEDAGLLVWLDKHEIKLGDSLREKIDEGLPRGLALANLAVSKKLGAIRVV